MPTRIISIALVLLFAFSSLACAAKKEKDKAEEQKSAKAEVRLGIERLDEFAGVFTGKRVGIITNATGIDRHFNDTAFILAQKVKLAAVFSPEHGYLGQVTAGEDIDTYTDQRLGVSVYSLYGPTKKPTADMLKNIDILAFDIQDIGVRSYTYISTMAYAMQACAEQGKEFVVFDRPNPLGGKMEGPVLKKGFESFVGVYPIPYRHGLTVGEAARLFNKEFGINAKLTVIPMTGWTHDMTFEETGLPWVPTSPNIPTPDSARGYAMTGFFGGIGVTNGVGTTRPFEFTGAPWVDAYKLAWQANNLKIPGLYFRPAAFLPRFGGHSGKSCYGVQVHFVDKKAPSLVESGAQVFYILRKMAGIDKINVYSKDRIDKNMGENAMWDNEPVEELIARWREECSAFGQMAQPYLLYK